ncbi:MAG: hypothetical protein ACR2LR_13020 [Hassallia sp.]
MKTIKSTILASTPLQPSISLTFQDVGIVLGIAVSTSALLILTIKAISYVNKISLSLTQIEKDIKELSTNTEKTTQLERRFDLHIQDYGNQKDVAHMLLGQLDEKINHKFKRLLFYSREMQRFLQKDTSFQIREYEETREEE